jgi:UDP-N-acetylglucosamine:LPS N-acetylglucosamine transferase
VVCGRNEALAERLRAQGVEHVFGWVDDMPGLMAAADVMVQNAGAASTLEAFASGLPVATYRCLPGHGRANAEVLDDAGLAVWVREPGDLAGVLLELTSGLRGLRQRTAALALVAGAAGQADSALLELIGEHFRSMSGPVLAAPTLNAVKALNVAPTSPRIPAPDGLAGLPTSALLTAV